MRTSNRNNNSAFILTLLYPFAGLIYTLYNWRKPWAKNVFWLACVYLGAVFLFLPEGVALGEGTDSARYQLDLINFYGDNSSLSDVLAKYRLERGMMDFYQPILTYFVSRFTDNAHALFAVFALVFGFFYSRNVWYILDKLPNKKQGIFAILTILYFLICPITQINGVRMWTALHVYVYALMPYLLDRDKKKLWCLALAPLIHFSFLYVSLFGLAYIMLPERMKAGSRILQIVALSTFAATLAVNSLNVDAVGGMLMEYSPESYEDRIEMYVNQDTLDRRAEEAALANWYIAVSGILKKWTIAVLLIFLFPCMKKYFKGEYGLNRLYLFALFLGAFANIMSLIPSGGRSQLVSMMFMVPMVLLSIMKIPKSDGYYGIARFAMLFLLIPVVVDFRRLFDFFGITAVFGNFITVRMLLVEFIENAVPV